MPTGLDGRADAFMLYTETYIRFRDFSGPRAEKS